MSDIVTESISEPYRDRHRQTDGIEPTATHMQIERQMQVDLEADTHGAVICTYREIQRERHTYRHACRQACRQSEQCMQRQT